MPYWLMKSEPSVFSIDDLVKRPQQTEAWDGVRNYQVRNWLRDTMKVGDQAFFYHSSCEIPGISGIVEIVKAGYPDITAFDPKHHHYDAKSHPEKPVWYCVDIKLVRKLKRLITLAELKNHPALSHMRLLQKGNRLSITPISDEEWKMILGLE